MNTRPTPETDEEFCKLVENANSPTAKCIQQLERERDERRATCAMLGENMAVIERERDEWKAKYIQQNKDLGCEQMDPNGTIWDHAKTLQRQRDEARAESIRWMSIAEGRGRTDDEEESDCSVCKGCFMIAGTEPNDDVMNTPCPKCNGHSEDTEKTTSNLIRERDEAREQLSEIEDKMRIELRGYHDSKLWGEAGLIAATMRCVDALDVVTAQRDRLAEAVNAATILIAAKGRHNTMLAYEGLREALQSLTQKP